MMITFNSVWQKITKKVFTLLILLMTTFISTSCHSNQRDEIKIMVPEGSPRIAQMQIEANQQTINGKKITVERVFGVDPLSVAFLSGSHHIIYAPINLGAKLIDMGVDYSFIATVTWGNLYLVSAQPIASIGDLDGQSILLFGQNSIPDIICRVLFENENFTTPPIISYVASVQNSYALLRDNTSRIVLLAEPMVSMILDEFPDLNIIDLQAEWGNYFGLASYPQSGVFVKNQLSEDIVDTYAQQLITSVEYVNQDSLDVIETAESLHMPYVGDNFLSSIQRSNIMFLSAYESRVHIINLFEKILSLSGDLINNRLPEESFYAWGAPK
jgi:NitT/TauT family transport system substrate-binding protein